jgi:hypothetical protein
MRSFGSLVCILTLTLLLVPQTRAESCCKEIAYSLSPIQQATQAQIVVIGKVTDLEPDLAMVEASPGSEKVAHMVANVRIDESLLGIKGLTHIRIGFVPSARMVMSDDAQFKARLNGVRSWFGGMNLTAGQEACFFLQKHPTADFYVLMQYAYPLDKGDLGYDTDIKAVRNILKAFEKPVEALRAKDAGERQLAACALVMRYRTQTNRAVPVFEQVVPVVNEPIPAEESKLILKALGEMKWGEQPFDVNGTFSLQSAFSQLGIGANDGWQQPQQKENEDFNAAMSEALTKWFSANADKYRVQRLAFKPQRAE